MDIDTIKLKLTSTVDNSVEKISSLVDKFKGLAGVSPKVANSLKNIEANTSETASKFDALTRSVDNTHRSMSKNPKVVYGNALKELNTVKQEYKDLKRYVDKIMYDDPSAPGVSAGINKLNEYKAKIKELEPVVADLKQKVLDSLNNGAKNGDIIPKDTGKQANKNLKDLKNTIKSTQPPIERLRNSARKLSDAFSTFHKGTSKGVDTLVHKFKKLGLGLLGIRTIMSLLTKSVVAYLSFDGELQDSIQNSWNMLGSLLAPAIEFVAEAFAQATAYVYTFLKAITGIDFVARANAKAIETQAKANAKLGKSQQGLLAMDEITNLPTASGGGSGNIPQIEVPEIKGYEIFSRLIQAIKDGDWYGAGKIIADGLNTAMDNIPWSTIRKKASQTGTGLAQFLNGGIENFHWDVAGQTLGNGINTAIDFAYSFISEFNWEAFGKGIGDFITNSFKTIEWDKLGKTISDGIKGVLTTLNNILTTTDWKEIGEDIRTLLMNIDWAGIGKDIVELVINGFKANHGLLEGLMGDDLISKWNLEKFDPFGSLLNDFDTLTLLWDEDVDKQMQGLDRFASKFGMTGEELLAFSDDILGSIGDFFGQLWDGIVEGSTAAWESVKQVFAPVGKFFNDVKDKIVNGFKSMGSKVGEVVGSAFRSVINSILTTVEDSLNFPIRAINTLTSLINNIPGIKLGKLPTLRFPRLATGTNNIESEGLYHLHEGEAVVPKKYNPATGGYDNGSDNRQIIDLLVSLNANMIALSEREMAVYMNGKKVAEGIYDDMQDVSRNRNVSGVMKRS